MFRVMGFLTKRKGMEDKAFVDYYENRHVPLILSLAPSPIVYKRRYVERGHALAKDDGALDFDVMTELVFADRAAFLAWVAAVSEGEAGERVAADEARFLDRSRTRSAIVDEQVTAAG
jgi:uncharacterized protein (TIGR02118 family)